MAALSIASTLASALRSEARASASAAAAAAAAALDDSDIALTVARSGEKPVNVLSSAKLEEESAEESLAKLLPFQVLRQDVNCTSGVDGRWYFAIWLCFDFGPGSAILA